MDKQELIERELEDLENTSSKFLSEVERTVSKIRKEECKLYLTKQDRYKLLILRSWVVRYKVDLYYILKTLLPFWEAFVQRRSRVIKRQGLNVRVSTLTGKKSEEILCTSISKDFPNGLNVQVFRTKEQERIYARAAYLFELKAGRDEIKVRPKQIKTLSKYVKEYKYKMNKENKRREKVELTFQKKPYRDNPFLD